MDNLTIQAEGWILPILAAIDDQLRTNQEREQADAERRSRKFGRRSRN